MPIFFDRFYIASLYVFLGMLIAVNVISIIMGAYLALVPLLVQSMVVFGVRTSKPWAVRAIVVWSVLAIVSGATLWISTWIGGAGNKEPIPMVLLRTSSLFAGIFFVLFAKSVLSRRVQAR